MQKSDYDRAERELQELAALRQAILNSANFSIISTDVDGAIRTFNATAERWLQYTAEEVVGKVTPAVIHDLDEVVRQAKILSEELGTEIEPGFDVFVARARLGRSDENEWTYIRKDGSRFPVMLSVTAIRDADGEITGFLGVGSDIAERKTTEASLQESEARTRAIVDTAVDSIITIEEDGRVASFNTAAERLFGYQREEVIGKNVNMLMPEPFCSEHDTYLRNYLGTGEAKIIGIGREVVGLRRDGSTFPMDLSVGAMRSGTHRMFVGVLRDITSRKQAEEELRKARDEAEDASRAKSEFLANMSHEIRTPMNGIIGMTELTLDTELTSEQREYLGMVRSSADSLLGIINDILDFSKIEAGRLDLENINFSLRTVLRDTLSALALRAHEKGLELAYHVQPDLPDALVGDPARLRQVIVNLVSNAVKFTEKGEIVLRVEAESQTESEVCLHLSVRDTGIGIPEDKQESIFEAFSQADGSITRLFGGTGLGLTISSQLVDLMGGRIWVESEEGVGTTFHFTACFGIQTGGGVHQVSGTVENLKGLRMLVVDDNTTNRRILEETLLNWKMRPVLVQNGPAALEAMARGISEGAPFALMLLDNAMPGMSGFDVAKRLGEDSRFAETRIIMLTSAGQRGDAARSRELKMAGYLTKPVNQSDLLDAILAALGTSPAASMPAPLVTRHSILEARQKLRVLLAEDNPVNQKLAMRVLEKWGHSVTLAENGREALEALRTGQFDLVLMDVQMPEMDGLAATATIREKERETGGHIPIVAMTAHAMEGDRERFLEGGMDAYVSKPVQTEALFEVIEGLGKGIGGRAASEQGVPGMVVFDLEKALASMEGDADLLGEVIDIFLENCPDLLGDVREAVRSRDGEAVERAAHSLKGAAGTIYALEVAAIARRLETMGREDELKDVQEIHAMLEDQVHRLESVLLDAQGNRPE